MWGGGSRYSVCVGVVVSITYISGNAFKLFAGLPLTRHAIGVKTYSKCVHNIHTIIMMLIPCLASTMCLQPQISLAVFLRCK